MDCCVVALSVFYSDILTWSADSLYPVIFSSMTHKLRVLRVTEHAYYANKLRENVGLETGIRHQVVTSQTAHAKYK